jgi:hypothetical protein
MSGDHVSRPKNLILSAPLCSAFPQIPVVPDCYPTQYADNAYSRLYIKAKGVPKKHIKFSDGIYYHNLLPSNML